MSDYILPDKDLQWKSINGTILKTSRKFTITYQDGRHSAAQIGGNAQFPSRKSILTIHDLTIYDGGKYTCVLSGTPQSIAMDLKIEALPRDTSSEFALCMTPFILFTNGHVNICNNKSLGS